MGEETGIQSATGTILHFLFLPFFSPVSLGLDSGRPNTQKRRLGTEFGEKPSSSSSRSKKLGSQCSERGNASVFSRSASIRRATVTVVAMGLAAQKLEGGRPFSLIRGAVVLRRPGKLLLFFLVLPPQPWMQGQLYKACGRVGN